MTKIRKIFLLASLAILIAIGFFVYYHFFTFHVTRTNPTARNIATLSPFLEIYFNKDVDNISSVSSTPDGLIDSYEIIDNKIFIKLNGMAPIESQIVISSINSQDGYNINDYTLLFTPEETLADDLPQDQLDYIIEQQDRFAPLKADPVLEFIPYSSIGYSIEPEIVGMREDGSNIIDINITINLSGADMRINPDQATIDYYNDAIDYLTSNGINIDDYTINQEIIEASLY